MLFYSALVEGMSRSPRLGCSRGDRSTSAVPSGTACGGWPPFLAAPARSSGHQQRRAGQCAHQRLVSSHLANTHAVGAHHSVANMRRRKKLAQ